VREAGGDLVGEPPVELGEATGDPFLALLGAGCRRGQLGLGPLGGSVIGRLLLTGRVTRGRPLRGEPAQRAALVDAALRPEVQQRQDVLAGELVRRARAAIAGLGHVDGHAVRGRARPLAGAPQQW